MFIPEHVMTLDPGRKITSGSVSALNEKIRKGADLRISTGFIYNEHVDISSGDSQLMAETSAFAETVLIDGKWSAYFMTLRQPVSLRNKLFGYPNSMSLFLYNQDGKQAVARLVLDGTIDNSLHKDSEKSGIPKMVTMDIFDEGTPGVSKNFIYDFEFYDFMANDCYEEIYSNDAEGNCTSGSIDALADAYRSGRGIKIAISGISDVMWGDSGHHDEIYMHCGSSYYYTVDKLMASNTHPFVSVPADIPLLYKSRSFKYCWAVAQTDGRAEIRGYDPFDGIWKTTESRLPVRWFSSR
jgi:hypothetical protein